MLRLGDRRFRFSVASNRVGHFIFGLRDRIWPDFICHFHLHRGATSRSRIVGWHADTELNGLASSPGLAIQSKWLVSNSKNGIDPASLMVFHKLGLVHSTTVTHSGAGPSPEISFGSLSGPDSQERPYPFHIGAINIPNLSGSHVTLPSFRGHRFYQGLWDNIPEETPFHILDGWQAGYDNESVKLMVGLPCIPTKDYIFERLKHCSRCDRFGHSPSICTGFFCQTCGDISG